MKRNTQRRQHSSPRLAIRTAQAACSTLPFFLNAPLVVGDVAGDCGDNTHGTDDAPDTAEVGVVVPPTPPSWPPVSGLRRPGSATPPAHTLPSLALATTPALAPLPAPEGTSLFDGTPPPVLGPTEPAALVDDGVDAATAASWADSGSGGGCTTAAAAAPALSSSSDEHCALSSPDSDVQLLEPDPDSESDSLPLSLPEVDADDCDDGDDERDESGEPLAASSGDMRKMHDGSSSASSVRPRDRGRIW